MRAIAYAEVKHCQRSVAPESSGQGNGQNQGSTSITTPRAVKTFEGRVCVIYDTHFRKLVNSWEWLRGEIEPRFAIYQMNAVLHEIAAGTDANSLREMVDEALKDMRSANIRSRSFGEYINERAKDILAGMDTAQRIDLYDALNKKALMPGAENGVKSYCIKLQHAIIKCEVETRKNDLYRAYSKVFGMSRKKENKFAEGVAEIKEITGEIYESFAKVLSGTDECTKLEDWICKAVQPSSKQLGQLARSMTNFKFKWDLLQNIDPHQKISPRGKIFAELYKRVDEAKKFGTEEDIARFKFNEETGQYTANEKTSARKLDHQVPMMAEGDIEDEVPPVAGKAWADKKIEELKGWDEECLSSPLSKDQLFGFWIEQIDSLLENFGYVKVGVLKDDEFTSSFNVTQVRQFKEDLQRFADEDRNSDLQTIRFVATQTGNLLLRSSTITLNDKITPAEQSFILISRKLFEIFLSQLGR